MQNNTQGTNQPVIAEGTFEKENQIKEILAQYSLKPFTLRNGETIWLPQLELTQESLDNFPDQRVIAELDQASQEGLLGIYSNDGPGFAMILTRTSDGRSLMTLITSELWYLYFDEDRILYKSSESLGATDLSLSSVLTRPLIAEKISGKISRIFDEPSWPRSISQNLTELTPKGSYNKVYGFEIYPNLLRSETVKKRLDAMCNASSVKALNFPLYKYEYGVGKVKGVSYFLEFRVVYYRDSGRSFLVPNICGIAQNSNKTFQVGSLEDESVLHMDGNYRLDPFVIFSLPKYQNISLRLLSLGMGAIGSGYSVGSYDGGFQEMIRESNRFNTSTAAPFVQNFITR